MDKRFPAFWIFYKDIIIELRTREITIPFFLFSFLLIIFVSFSLPSREFSPFVFWLSFLFSGIITLSKYIIREMEGGFKGMLTSPLERESIYTGKVFSLFTFLFFSGILLYFLFVIFLNFPISIKIFFYFLLLLSLISFSFASLGVLLSFLSFHTKAREFFLPLLFIPLFIPPFISALSLTQKLLIKEKIFSAPFYILLFFSIFYYFLNQILFEEVVME